MKFPQLGEHGQKVYYIASTVAMLAIAQLNEAFINNGSKADGALSYRQMTSENKQKLQEIIGLAKSKIPDGSTHVSTENQTYIDFTESMRRGTTYRIYNTDSKTLLTGILQRIPVIMEAGGVQVIPEEAYDTDGDGKLSNAELTVVLDKEMTNLKK